jgi:outer membrane protein TolC
VTLRAAELALAEERYRAGQITKKELDRARAAYEFARDRAASTRQFLTAAQARLIDLRNAKDP